MDALNNLIAPFKDSMAMEATDDIDVIKPTRKAPPSRSLRNEDHPKIRRKLSKLKSIEMANLEQDPEVLERKAKALWPYFWVPGFDYGAFNTVFCGQPCATDSNELKGTITEPHSIWVISPNTCDISINNPRPTILLHDAPPPQYLDPVLLNKDVCSGLFLPYSEAFTRIAMTPSEYLLAILKQRETANASDDLQAEEAQQNTADVTENTPDNESAKESKYPQSGMEYNNNNNGDDDKYTQSLDRMDVENPPATRRKRNYRRTQTEETSHPDSTSNTPNSSLSAVGRRRRRTQESEETQDTSTNQKSVTDSLESTSNGAYVRDGSEKAVQTSVPSSPSNTIPISPNKQEEPSSEDDYQSQRNKFGSEYEFSNVKRRQSNSKKRKRDDTGEDSETEIHTTTRKKRTQHSMWTPEESQRLIDLAVEGAGRQHWIEICSLLNSEFGCSKTPTQCSQHYHRVVQPHIAKTKWSSTEDTQLLELAQDYFPDDIPHIAKTLGRTTKQVTKRLARYNMIATTNVTTRKAAKKAASAKLEEIEQNQEEEESSYGHPVLEKRVYSPLTEDIHHADYSLNVNFDFPIAEVAEKPKMLKIVTRRTAAPQLVEPSLLQNHAQLDQDEDGEDDILDVTPAYMITSNYEAPIVPSNMQSGEEDDDDAQDDIIDATPDWHK